MTSFLQRSGWKTIGLRIIAKATTKSFHETFPRRLRPRTTLPRFKDGNNNTTTATGLFFSDVIVPSRPTLGLPPKLWPDLYTQWQRLAWTLTPRPESIARILERFLALSWNEVRLYRSVFVWLSHRRRTVVLTGPVLTSSCWLIVRQWTIREN
jgi:hypothetical protein